MADQTDLSVFLKRAFRELQGSPDLGLAMKIGASIYNSPGFRKHVYTKYKKAVCNLTADECTSAFTEFTQKQIL